MRKKVSVTITVKNLKADGIEASQIRRFFENHVRKSITDTIKANSGTPKEVGEEKTRISNKKFRIDFTDCSPKRGKGVNIEIDIWHLRCVRFSVKEMTKSLGEIKPLLTIESVGVIPVTDFLQEYVCPSISDMLDKSAEITHRPKITFQNREWRMEIMAFSYK